MYPALMRILIDIKGGETNNGCSTQDRSVLRAAIPTPCLGFFTVLETVPMHDVMFLSD